MERDHLNSDEWKGFRDRSLPPAELLALSDHLAACPDCARVRDETGVSGFRFEHVKIDHPAEDPFEEIAAWVDGLMTDPVDREIFEERLKQDPQLRAAADNLAAFKAETSRLTPREHSPLEAAKIVPFPRPTASHWFYPLAAAAAVVIVTVLSSTLSSEKPSSPDVASLGPVALPALPPELQTTRETLAGEEQAPTLVVSPLPGPIVRNRRPTLAWKNSAPAEGYVVLLERLPDGAITTSPTLPGAARSWQPEAPLDAGAIYEWQVQALRAGAPVDQAPAPPEPEARFKVLDAASEHALILAENTAPRSELTLGMAFARAGLPSDADAHWKAAGPAGDRLRAELHEAQKKAGYLR